MTNCPYCDAFENGFKYGEKALYESDNFIVFPALGQIVEGYLLIVSKKHYISMGQVPSGLYSELDSVCRKVREVLSDNYEIPLFFEHGAVSQIKKGGCCIEHAHLHAVPIEVDIMDELAGRFEYSKIKSFFKIRRQFKKGISYFYYESNLGERYLFEISEIVPSQYIRRVIANKVGRPERWNWKNCFGLDELLRTVDKLEGKF